MQRKQRAQRQDTDPSSTRRANGREEKVRKRLKLEKKKVERNLQTANK
jgi:hypothetical protein